MRERVKFNAFDKKKCFNALHGSCEVFVTSGNMAFLLAFSWKSELFCRNHERADRFLDRSTLGSSFVCLQPKMLEKYKNSTIATKDRNWVRKGIGKSMESARAQTFHICSTHRYGRKGDKQRDRQRQTSIERQNYIQTLSALVICQNKPITRLVPWPTWLVTTSATNWQ